MSHDERFSPPAARETLIAFAAAAAAALLAVLSAAAIQTGQEKPREETDVCANDTCHPDIVSHAVMHRPTAQGQCDACHDYADPAEHLFELVTEPEELCWECHDLDFEEVVHVPVDEGRCMTCHDPHGSSQPVMLVKDPSQGLCYDCHDQDDAKRAFVHGPVAAGACLACHKAHSSAHEKLLIDTPTPLCLSCHTEVVPDDLTGIHLHEPMKQDCAGCHDAHASDFRYQVRAGIPELCFSCHQKVKESLDGVAIVHGPVVAADGGCASCHSPHFSTEAHLLVKPQGELCLRCHNEPVKAGDGRTLTGMAELFKTNPGLHGPVRDGECSACHVPHAGEYAQLLNADYPMYLYVPFEFERYELCFSCHPEELVEEDSGDGVTGFRDGDRNLHWLHVNRKKGRSCRACHEVHASRQPFLIRETMPFGSAGWVLKMNYSKSDDGGSCAPGCHRAQTYRRDAR